MAAIPSHRTTPERAIRMTSVDYAGPNNLTALTPAHFLVGESLITLAEPAPLLEVKRHALTRLELVQQMHQDIWKRWHREYLATLIQ